MNQEIFTYRHPTEELDRVLLQGKISHHGEIWVALPREVMRNSAVIETVVFEGVRLSDFNSPSFFKVLLHSVRPDLFPFILLPSLSVFLYGGMKGWQTVGIQGFLALLGGFFLQIALNLLSEVEDYLRMRHLFSPGANSGSLRLGPIQRGWVSAQRLRYAGYFALVLGVAFGIPIVFSQPGLLLLIGAFAVGSVIAFSGHPFASHYRVLREPLTFILAGPLLSMGVCQALFGRMESGVLVLGLCFGFLACSVSTLGRLQEIERVRLSGRVTLATLLGFQGFRHVVPGLYGLVYATVGLGIYQQILPWTVGAGLFMGFPFLVSYLNILYKISGPESALWQKTRVRAHALYIQLGCLVCFGLLFASFVR